MKIEDVKSAFQMFVEKFHSSVEGFFDISFHLQRKFRLSFYMLNFETEFSLWIISIPEVLSNPLELTIRVSYLETQLSDIFPFPTSSELGHPLSH